MPIINSCSMTAPAQPNISGRKILGAAAMKFSVHHPMWFAPIRDPMTKNNRLNICMAKPSPTRIRVPDAHPPAITMPIPNMMPPTAVARLIGMM